MRKESLIEEGMQELHLDEKALPTTPVLGPRSKVVTPIEAEERLLLPMINRQSLAEIDIEQLVENAQIMHDLLFDPGVRLKPNPVRRSSQDYLHASSQYWTQLEAELAERKVSGGMPLMTGLLTEIKAMIMGLYPECSEIMGEFNQLMEIPVLIKRMQQANQVSLADLIPLITPLIRQNCAPRRDGLLVAMEEMAAEGLVIPVLRLCLDLCEQMKLDLVNHRLCKERVNYSRIYVERERALVTSTRVTEEWLRANSDSKLSVKEVFHRSLIHLICNCNQNTLFPETLSLDRTRLEQLRVTMRGLVLLGLLLLKCRQMKAQPGDGQNLVKGLKAIISKPGCTVSQVVTDLSSLISRDARAFLKSDPERDPVGTIIRKKLIEALDQAVRGGKVDPQFLCKLGLKELEGEVSKFLSDCAKLAVMNWTVHGELYIRLCLSPNHN